MENGEQPLLPETTNLVLKQKQSPLTSSSSSNYLIDDEDIGEIDGLRDFCREFFVESKKLWYLAMPAIFTSVCQYTIGATTQVLAGRLGTIQLAAVSVENSVIAGFSYGIMLGMGSGLETLCGQAYGAGNHEMLGIYMQRSWIILNSAAILLTSTYILGVSILKLLGQTAAISAAAGKFAIWMIPQLFAYATMIPITKFLQAQSHVMAMAVIAAVAVVGHCFFSWLLMMKLGWGLVGAAVVLDGSWWFITVAQLLYVLWGWCGRAWTGFSSKAFRNLEGFLKLSFTTALMFCLEVWYTMSLVLFAGYFEDAEASVDALSICINILGWANTVALGLNVAVSVRVSNELGQARPRTARFSVVVVLLTSMLIGIIFTTFLVITRGQYPAYFTSSATVMELVDELTWLLGVSIIVTSAQFALSGVAIGAGWQAAVAYMNVGSYFMFGIPVSYVLGFKFNMGVKGIWYGMVSGVSLQSLLLLLMVCRTNWIKEAYVAGDRIKQWGGEADEKDRDVERIIQ